METETLFLKDELIKGSNVEIIFHKEFAYFFNTETFPIVKFSLLGCEDLASKNFDDIDCYNDGVFVETKKEGNSNFFFEATDIGGRVFQIHCQNIVREELNYRKQDCVDLINELVKQRDEEYATATKHYEHYEGLKTFLEKRLILSKER